MKKCIPLLLGILLLIPNKTISTNKLFLFTGIGLSLTGLYGLYRLRKKSTPFQPSIKSLNTLTFNTVSTSLAAQSTKIVNLEQLVDHVSQKTIPYKAQLVTPNKKNIAIHQGITVNSDEELIFLSSRGYAKRTKLLVSDERELVKSGGCAIAANILVQDNIVHDHPCITFDYPDDRTTFSFGQDTDYQCLKTIWNAVLQQYPNAGVVGIGDCRGARALLEIATTNPKNLKALILLSPYISSRDLTEQVAKNHLGWLPGSSFLLHTFFRSYFSSYNPANDTLVNRLHYINPKLPIFIGHRKNDKLVSEKSMKHLLETLKRTGHKDVYFFVVKDNAATHSRISHIPELQQAINTFFAQYNLPHNKKLAAQGKTWLMQAHSAAQEKNLKIAINYS